MANKSLITNGAKVNQVEQMYYSPVAVVPPLTQVPLGTLYCFLSRVDPWTNDLDPPMPLEDVRSLKSVFKNMFVARQITSNDISPVIERKDWESGAVYDYHSEVFRLLPHSVDCFGHRKHKSTSRGKKIFGDI